MAFDVGAIVARMVLDTKQWVKSTSIVKKSQQNMATQVKKTGSSFSTMWKQVAIGAGVTTAITRGMRLMSREFTDVFRKGREFEKQWANVTTMLSISREETIGMRDELRRLSPTLGDTADLAKGMYQVLSASIEPAKAIKFLGTAAKAAKAGITDTRTAVDAITTVINAYGMEAEDAAEVSDIMFSTVKRGKLTFAEMATSLGTVVPVASKVGLSFREVAAAMSTLTRQGVDARTTTMQLRQVIMSILSPTDDATKLAEELGFAWSADALKADGLAKMLRDLEEGTGGNNELLKLFVPNVRALTAVMGLAGEAAEGFAEDLDRTKEAAGLTDEAFQKQMETMDFWLEAAEVTRDKWKIAFYEGLISPMREAIRTSEDFEEKFTQKTNEVADAISLHMSAIWEEISAVGKIFSTVDKVVFGWSDKLKKGTTASDSLASATDRLNESLKRLRETQTEETFTTIRATEVKKKYGETITQIVLPPAKDMVVTLKEAGIQTEGLGITTEMYAEILANTAVPKMKDLIATLNRAGIATERVGITTELLIEQTKEYPKGMQDAVSEVIGILAYLGNYVKALAYASAIINTAQAVTKALSAYPPPLSFAMATIQAAAGAVQIAAISKQDIPTAEKGAYMPRPAVVEAGHGPMGEVILPLDKAPAFGGGAIHLNFYSPLITATELTERNVDEMSVYLFDSIEREASRRGYALNGA